MKAAIASMQRQSLRLPPKLTAMFARYIEAANSGRDPVKLFRTGAQLLNNTFRLAADGCGDTLATMAHDRIDAVQLALAAELFETAASTIERERERCNRSA